MFREAEATVALKGFTAKQRKFKSLSFLCVCVRNVCVVLGGWAWRVFAEQSNVKPSSENVCDVCNLHVTHALVSEISLHTLSVSVAVGMLCLLMPIQHMLLCV